VPRLRPNLQRGFKWPYGLVALLAVAMADAGEPVGNAPLLRGPQLMMYFQLPVGHSSQPLALYGLRIEQSRLQSALSTTTPAQTPYHQQLLDLQLRPHADMQLEFGRRLSWDVGRESFSAPANPPTFLLRWPIESRRPAEALPQALLGGWPQPLKANPNL
jgi:hypothetical protein